MGLLAKIKSFYSNTIDYILKTKFFQYELKQRIQIIIATFFLTLYFSLSFSVIKAGNDYIIQNKWRIIFSFIIIFIAILNLFILLVKNKIKVKKLSNSKNLFLIALAIMLVIMLGMYFVGETIGTSSDIQDQYNQAVTGEYNNWHPVAHTFLFYKLPIVIFGESINSVMLFQYLFMAGVFAYLIYSMIRFGHKAYLIIIMIALMLINNSFRYIIKFPWKDIPFAFSLLLLTTCLMWIYFTKGKWLKSKWNVAFFIVSCMLVLLLRHNGILAFIPTSIALILAYKSVRIKIAIICASMLVVYFAITSVLFGLLDIKGHSQSFAEAVGVPNNQLCYIVKNYGNLTDEQREFINSIVPVSVIKNNYEIGNFNSIKWRKNIEGTAYYYSGEFIQENKQEYIKTWLNVLRNNKRLAVEGYFYATRELWVSRLKIADKFDYSVGLAFFVASFLIAAAAFKDKRRLVVYVPMLFNILGIMLLVTGGETRFVFANLVCGVPLILFALTPSEINIDGYEAIN